MNLQFFEVGVAIAMGVLGYIMLRLEWPVVTWVLGLALGPIIEDRLRESLSMSSGDPAIFVTRPISLGFVIVIIFIVIIPLVLDLKKKRSQ